MLRNAVLSPLCFQNHQNQSLILQGCKASGVRGEPRTQVSGLPVLASTATALPHRHHLSTSLSVSSLLWVSDAFEPSSVGTFLPPLCAVSSCSCLRCPSPQETLPDSQARSAPRPGQLPAHSPLIPPWHPGCIHHTPCYCN